MIIDHEGILSDQQSVTNSAASTNYINFGDAKDRAKGNPIGIEVVVDETVTSDGEATVDFYLYTDSTAVFTPDKSIPLALAVPKATLVRGYVVYRGRLPEGLLQYLEGYYNVNTANLTAGKFTMRLLENFQSNV